jgi:hypothetical protein
MHIDKEHTSRKSSNDVGNTVLQASLRRRLLAKVDNGTNVLLDDVTLESAGLSSLCSSVSARLRRPFCIARCSSMSRVESNVHIFCLIHPPIDRFQSAAAAFFMLFNRVSASCLQTFPTGLYSVQLPCLEGLSGLLLYVGG